MIIVGCSLSVEKEKPVALKCAKKDNFHDDYDCIVNHLSVGSSVFVCN